MNIKIGVFGYSHINKEGMILTGPFKTRADAVKFDKDKFFGYYSDSKIEKVEASKIHLFKEFVKG